MQIYDDEGELVRATFHAEFLKAEPTVRFESCGGKEGGDKLRRNADYNFGLELVLERLGAGGATLLGVEVDSADTKDLARAERQLTIDEAAFPIPLYQRDDYRQLRVGLGRGAARVAQAADSVSDGNRQKQVRLHLRFPARAPVSERWLNALLSRAPAGSESPQTSSASTAGGQGRSQDPQRRRAVELHAMASARAHFEGAGWSVVDVSTQSGGFDLLCTRGEDRLRVEVKGSSGAGVAVFLTKNEVDQAHCDPGGSALFVVYLIEVEACEGAWTCTGGVPRILHNWDPRARGKLKPLQYEYTLPPLSDDDGC